MDIYPRNIPGVKELKCKYSNDLQIVGFSFLHPWTVNRAFFPSSFLEKNPQLLGESMSWAIFMWKRSRFFSWRICPWHSMIAHLRWVELESMTSWGRWIDLMIYGWSMEGYVGQPDSKTPVSVIPCMQILMLQFVSKMPKGNVQSYQYHLSIPLLYSSNWPSQPQKCDSYLPMDSHSILRFCFGNLYALESLHNKQQTWHNTLARSKGTTLKDRYGRVRDKVV